MHFEPFWRILEYFYIFVTNIVIFTTKIYFKLNYFESSKEFYLINQMLILGCQSVYTKDFLKPNTLLKKFLAVWKASKCQRPNGYNSIISVVTTVWKNTRRSREHHVMRWFNYILKRCMDDIYSWLLVFEHFSRLLLSNR